MKFLSILIILFCSQTSVFGDNNFENRYELTGIKDLTDQAMIRSISGDDYFFGIEDSNIVCKRKLKDSDFFDEFIPDFSYHNFSSFKEIEGVHFSNNRDMLFFVAVENGLASINVMSFDSDNVLIFRDDLRFDLKIGTISFFRIFNDNDDNLTLLYSKNNILRSLFFSNNFKEQIYEEEVSIGIEGEILQDASIIDYRNYSPSLNNLIVTNYSDKKRLWILKIQNKKYNKLEIKFSKDTSETDSPFYGFSKNVQFDNIFKKTLLYIDFDNMRLRNKPLKSNTMDVFDEKKLFEVLELNGGIDSINNISSWLYINPYLTTFNKNKIKVYLLKNKILTLLDKKSFTNKLDYLKIIYINDNFVKFKNTNIYLSLDIMRLIYSDSIPKNFRYFILSKDDNFYLFESGRN